MIARKFCLCNLRGMLQSVRFKSSADRMQAGIVNLRSFFQEQSNYILGADDLHRIKATIGGLQDGIIKEKEELLRENDLKMQLTTQLSECESNIEHLRKFRKHSDGHNLGPDEYITTLNSLHATQHQLQQQVDAAKAKSEELSSKIQKLQVTLDTQLALRYQEELLVLERSRAFSGIATMASFITTCLLIVSRSFQTNTYEKSIEEARAFAETTRIQSQLDQAKAVQRDELLASLLAQLVDTKSLLASQQQLLSQLTLAVGSTNHPSQSISQEATGESKEVVAAAAAAAAAVKTVEISLPSSGTVGTHLETMSSLAEGVGHCMSNCIEWISGPNRRHVVGIMLFSVSAAASIAVGR